MPQVSCGQRSDRYPCTGTGRVDSRTNGDVLACSDLHKQHVSKHNNVKQQ